MHRDFREAMACKGLDCREPIIDDGKIHRFAPKGCGSKDAWYVLHGMAGAFGDWRQDIHEKWTLSNGSLSYEDKKQLNDHIEQAKKATEEEIQARQHRSMLAAALKWKNFSETGSIPSPYLQTKKVEAFGIRFDGDSLVVPLKDSSGKLCCPWIGHSSHRGRQRAI